MVENLKKFFFFEKTSFPFSVPQFLLGDHVQFSVFINKIECSTDNCVSSTFFP